MGGMRRLGELGKEMTMLPVTIGAIVVKPVLNQAIRRAGPPLTRGELEDRTSHYQLEKAFIGAAALTEAAELRPKPGTPPEVLQELKEDTTEFAIGMIEDALIKAVEDPDIPVSEVQAIVELARDTDFNPGKTHYVSEATRRFAAARIIE